MEMKIGFLSGTLNLLSTLMGCVALGWTDKFVAIAQHQPLEFIVKFFEPDIKFPESVSHCAMME